MEKAFLFVGGPWNGRKVKISNPQKDQPVEVPVLSESILLTLADPTPAATFYMHRYFQYQVRIFDSERTIYAKGGLTPEQLGELIWCVLEGEAGF